MALAAMSCAHSGPTKVVESDIPPEIVLEDRMDFDGEIWNDCSYRIHREAFPELYRAISMISGNVSVQLECMRINNPGLRFDKTYSRKTIVFRDNGFDDEQYILAMMAETTGEQRLMLYSKAHSKDIGRDDAHDIFLSTEVQGRKEELLANDGKICR